MRRFLVPLIVIALIIITVISFRQDGGDKPIPTKQPVKTQHSKAGFDAQAHSLTDPTSIWLVVNKHRPLNPIDYTPADLVKPDVAKRDGSMQLRRDTAGAMKTMFDAAAKAGTPLKLASAYRSYQYQVNLYNSYVKSQGQPTADAESARPGYSEHQTGMAADVSPLDGTCNLSQCFATTQAGQWLAANAYKYGFIVRYPDGLTDVTGYEYEPWHIRYIGIDLATQLHDKNVQTLEQFFNLGSAPNYQ